MARHASLDDYWRRFGDRIGEAVKGVQPPADAGPVQTRAVRVRPGVVLSIVPQDLNIVLQRIQPALERQPFDLIVATNIFVYYDAFEHARPERRRMLRPGGCLKQTPERVVPTMTPGGATTVIAQTGRTTVIDRLVSHANGPRSQRQGTGADEYKPALALAAWPLCCRQPRHHDGAVGHTEDGQGTSHRRQLGRSKVAGVLRTNERVSRRSSVLTSSKAGTRDITEAD